MHSGTAVKPYPGETFRSTDTIKLEWECEKGHKWEAAPKNIKKGKWCPYCAEYAKYSIENAKHLSEKRGGKCLSEKYIKAYTKLIWQCSEGHQWEARFSSIKGGTWCPHCAKENKNKYLRLTIEEMQQIAKERGGKCLSDSYVNSMTKLKWECSNGHQWDARPSDIKNGKTWCPECHKNKKIQKGSQAQLQFF